MKDTGIDRGGHQAAKANHRARRGARQHAGLMAEIKKLGIIISANPIRLLREKTTSGLRPRRRRSHDAGEKFG